MSLTSANHMTSTARLVAVVFTLTIFLSASLLFFVQPLFAKIVLPAIGGSPAVWTTAMLFFQTVLLGGYLYAHFSTRFLPLPAQIGVHLAIWAVALIFLPPALPEGWQLDAARPIAGQTLWLFALGVGVPFALLSSNAPLIQSWYARSGGPSADDPYFLYGASNLGSMLALLAFPLLAEPLFGASAIANGFAAGFVLLGLGLAGCSVLLRGADRQVAEVTTDDAPAPAVSTLLYWGLLAFVPSSLMLAVTAKISVDIGAVPLVWVIPLALYLLTFVITFNQNSVVSGPWLTRVAQLVTVAALCLMTGVMGAHLSVAMIVVLIACFFVITAWSHRTLYEARPAASHLTIFYVVMSLGGAAGGLFNSIVGPVLFSDNIEGIATLLVVLLLVFGRQLGIGADSVRRGVALGLPLGLAASGLALLAGGGLLALGGAVIGALALLALAQRRVDVLLVGASLVVALPMWLALPDARVFADRSFFGLHQVVDKGGVRLYSNGTTIHGAQRVSDLGAARPKPISYYHNHAPMGQVMLSDFAKSAKRVGIVGLGVGSLACYAQEGQDWHFYEIDEMVDKVARNPQLFSFVTACAPQAPTHLGDARVVLAGQQDMKYDILLIDAYSSDAVPVHLTTLEAMELYLDRLAPGGLLVFHISNRYYDIGLPIGRSAEALGVHAWRQFAAQSASDDPGYQKSDVAIIARDPADIADILGTGRWTPIRSDGGPVWTDDKADPLSILKPSVFGR